MLVMKAILPRYGRHEKREVVGDGATNQTLYVN